MPTYARHVVGLPVRAGACRRMRLHAPTCAYKVSIMLLLLEKKLKNLLTTPDKRAMVVVR